MSVPARLYQARVAPIGRPIVLDGHTIELDEFSLRYEARHPRTVPVCWRHRFPVGRLLQLIPDRDWWTSVFEIDNLPDVVERSVRAGHPVSPALALGDVRGVAMLEELSLVAAGAIEGAKVMHVYEPPTRLDEPAARAAAVTSPAPRVLRHNLGGEILAIR